MSDSDITYLAKDYSSRSPITSRINFKPKRINKLKLIIHWSQDHRCVSSTPNEEGLYGTNFNRQLVRTSQRTETCKQLHYDSGNKAKAPSPGPLES